MLFLVKKPWCYQLATGEKTIELRAGSRYRNLAFGDIISVNGRERYQIEQAELFETREQYLDALKDRHRDAGFDSPDSLRQGIAHCYGSHAGPFFAFTLSRILAPAQAGQNRQTQSLPLFD
jgi:hypothetical protein